MKERIKKLTRRESINLLQKKIQDVKHEYMERAERKCDPNKAVLSEVVPSYWESNAINRLFVILTSPGCWYALGPKGPCMNCGFLDVTTRGETVTAEQYVRQLTLILDQHDFAKENIRELNLYNAGSFFNDAEISREARIEILSTINKNKFIKYLLVDSHARDIGPNKIKEAKEVLTDTIFEVGIGLESKNSYVRNVCINKNLNLSSFEKAVNILKNANARLVVYLLFKPIFLTEKEAIEDAIATVQYVFDLSAKMEILTRISLEPVAVQGMSLLPKLYRKGFYKPPWLWSIVEVLKRTAGSGEIRVGVPEEEPYIFARSENQEISGRRCPCNQELARLIEEYNRTLNVEVFNGIQACKCKDLWVDEINKQYPPLEQRVESFLMSQEFSAL